MKYLFMPLNQHIEDGFGATAEAFEQSAKLLSSSSDDVTYHYQIPLCFLYRHAIELYLKSAIVVLHRALAIPYDKNPHNGPAFVLVKKNGNLFIRFTVSRSFGDTFFICCAPLKPNSNEDARRTGNPSQMI
jgi:hypothetical protein